VASFAPGGFKLADRERRLSLHSVADACFIDRLEWDISIENQ